ncbi:MAG: hypothetical protein RBT80_13300 [Candidatus Vecturithrix sp.]|jgi:hypothetical protein|nr:hypothetical protein [Candidatus Vecturithrix sp.]
MDKSSTQNAHKTIEYRIDSINIINHFEKHFSEYGLKSSDIKNGDCEIGIDIRIKADKSCIAIPMKVSMSVMHDDNKCELFATEAIYTFGIKKFKSLFAMNEQGDYVIPDTFMRILIGTALSGMRGIMIASTTIAEYKKIILPMIETSKILENLNQAHSARKLLTKPSA